MKKAAPTKDKTTKKTPKNKKKIIIISTIVSLVVVIGGCLLGFAIWREETKPVLADELTFEINSEIANSSLLLDGYEIINEENIKTDELGEHEYTIRYRKGGREKELTFSYSIVDTTAPEITADDIIEIIEGEETDLASKATVKDNSKEDLKIEIEGEYDVGKVGEYNLKFITEDSSGNKTEKAFTLKVNAKPEEKTSGGGSTNGYSTANSSNRYSSSSYYAADNYISPEEPAACKTFGIHQVVGAEYWGKCDSVTVTKCTFYWYGDTTPSGSPYWSITADGRAVCYNAEETVKQQLPMPSMDSWYEGAHVGSLTLYVTW